jgi:exodeoxyribonuclease VII small subunit
MAAQRPRSDAAPPPAGESAPELRFEEALAQLEALVERLESGELDLEQALATFEQGVALAKQGSARLEAAELRIKQLEAGARGPAERELDLEDDA